MNDRAIENHRLVMLAKAAAHHHESGDAIEYTRACGMLADMCRNEIKDTSKALAEKLAAGQSGQ